MADVQIQHADLIVTLEAQRNEALNAAAQSGAAVRSLMRRVGELEKELAEARALEDGYADAVKDAQE